VGRRDKVEEQKNKEGGGAQRRRGRSLTMRLQKRKISRRSKLMRTARRRRFSPPLSALGSPPCATPHDPPSAISSSLFEFDPPFDGQSQRRCHQQRKDALIDLPILESVAPLARRFSVCGAFCPGRGCPGRWCRRTVRR
jgi:hypothetical protein